MHITLSYHFFWSKVKAIEIEVILITTNDQLAYQFTKVLHKGNFELTQKAIIRR